MTSNLVILPLILHKISASEFGMWSVFLAVGAFASLFDLGFGNVVTRYVTFAYCGAEDIPKHGTPAKVSDQGHANYVLLFDVLLTARRVYRYIGISVLVILLLFSLYIYHLSVGTIKPSVTLLAWVIFSLGVTCNMYFNYCNSFFKGLGKIKEMQYISISNQLCNLLLRFVLIAAGYGLLGLGIATLCTSIMYRYQYAVHINKMIRENITQYNKAVYRFRHRESIHVYRSILFNSKKIGWTLVANYIQNQGNTLLCSVYLPLHLTGMYGLSMQLVSVLTNMASIPFNIYLPQMSSYRLINAEEKLKDLFSFVTSWIWIVYLLGSVILVNQGSAVLKLIKSNTSLLSPAYLTIIVLSQFVVINHQRATSFISVGNEQPYVRSYVLTSLFSLSLSVVSFELGYGLLGFIIVNLSSQLMYNAWKWPHEARKIMNLGLRETIIRTQAMIVKHMSGR